MKKERNELTSVAVAVIQRKGKILIARRRKEDPLKGKWEFPGGKMKKGETPEECLIREIREELGIEINICGIVTSVSHKYDHIHVHITFYLAEILSGELIPRFHDEIRWVHPDRLEQFDFPEANRGVIKKLADGEKGVKKRRSAK